jgi:hypothetical protein
MELRHALARRRMRRAFSSAEIDPLVITELCEEALRAPTAGHSRGVFLTVTSDVPGFFESATDRQWRERSRRFTDLAGASCVVIVTCSPTAYAQRYQADDKSDERLTHPDTWPVPYWIGDAGMATMALLLLIEEAGLHATFWGAFRHDEQVRSFADLPADELIYGYVLIGEGAPDTPSASLARDGLTRAQRVRLLTR